MIRVYSAKYHCDIDPGSGAEPLYIVRPQVASVGSVMNQDLTEGRLSMEPRPAGALGLLDDKKRNEFD